MKFFLIILIMVIWEDFIMNRILGTISLILVVAFLSTINLFAQATVEIGSAGFTMIENVEGPSNGQQYFSIDERSNTFLDGSENYYSVSMKTPHTDDCFGKSINITAMNIIRNGFFICILMSYNCFSVINLSS